MKCTKLLCLIPLVGVIFALSFNNVFAYSKDECISGSGIPQLDALDSSCEYCLGHATRLGIIWFNDSSSNSHAYGVTMQNTTQKTVYLWGQYNQCNSAVTTAGGMDAYRIHFLNPGTGESVSYLSDPSATAVLNRGRISKAGVYAWSNPGGSIATTLYLNDDFYNDATWDDSKGAYILDVDVYRCPKAMDEAADCSAQSSPIIVYTEKHDGEKEDDEDEDGDVCPLPYSFTSSASSGWNNGKDGGRSSVASGVKNLSTSNTWKKEVYARPDNKIQYAHCFYSGAQEVYIDEDCSDDCDCSRGSETRYVANPNRWSISTVSDLDAKGTGGSKSYDNSNDIHKYTSNGRIDPSDVSGEYTQDASTSTESIDTYFETHDCECNECSCGCSGGEGEPCDDPMDCDCGYSHESKVADLYTDGDSDDSATVIVPYNFYNSATAKIHTEYVFAGETANISGWTTVNARYNGHEDISSTYATRVDNAKVALITFASTNNQTGRNGLVANGTSGGSSSDFCRNFSYISGNCSAIFSDDSIRSNNRQIQESYTLNKDGITRGAMDDVITKGVFSVYDVSAGNYFCVSVAVYPANSGSYTNTSSSWSSGWAISPSYCVPVAKKPIFQVWGGSIYSSGGITINNIISKNNLANNFSSWTDARYGYNKGKGHTAVNFTPWVELMVVANNGTVSGLASGAATGYTNSLGDDSSRAPAANPGGRTINTNSCNISYLTIANCTPLSKIIGNSGIEVDTSTREELKKEYITNNEGKLKNNVRSGNVDLASIERDPRSVETTADQNKIAYTRGSNLTIYRSQPLAIGTTHIIHATGSITITSDLLYTNAIYPSVNQVPQHFIYAGGDIRINCNVKEIDAFLIAEGKIITCADSSNANEKKRSTQLKIKGAIIAGSLDLGRTYGAATGANTIVPAEIIDFSPTVFFWSRGNASDTPTLHTAYTRELAPRY